MKSVRTIFSFALAGNRSRRDELAFLPAALEIVETPPAPLAGALGAIVIGLFCAALIWASLGSIDIVASAQGKIVSSSRTQIIQPFETGVVRAIRVSDGQSVKKGEVLIELDPTISAAESQHYQGDLIAAELDVARLKAALSTAADPAASFEAPDGASASQIAVQRNYLARQLDERRAKLGALDRQKSQKEAELATVAASVKKLETVLPVLQQRVEIREVLYAHQTGSKANYLELYQAFVDAQQELGVQKSKLREAEEALAALVEAGAQADAEYARNRLAELAEAQRKAEGLREDLVKATQKTKQQSLTSPVDGVVQQLAVHTVGGIVTPAQALLAVAPADSRVEIEANVSNRDIGFIHKGQAAEIKIDTFNFTRYGLAHGRVLGVSQDAIVHERRRDARDSEVSGTPTETSEPADQELIYAARVSLDHPQMQVDENLVNLSPGMAVTVEIKTGERSIISYLLSPLIKYRRESLRER